MSLLQVHELGVQRKDRWVFRNLSFELAGGEALAITGPSGAGKTTLLWTILGLLEPNEGEVRLQGEPWSVLTEAQRRPRRNLIQAMFQDPLASLPPHRTGWEILEEPLVIHQQGDGATRKEAVRAMAARVKFPEACLAQRPAQWSGGLAQRLSLARALMLHPKIVALDEPLSALDPTLASHLLELLLELKAEGLALLMVTHNPKAATRLCDRTLQL
ncbi:MAG: ABC transporter ATP-binding protein [Holophaga sp.]|nr:ABC transporter ATP-binding protein [Holophaga sp.]